MYFFLALQCILYDINIYTYSLTHFKHIQYFHAYYVDEDKTMSMK